MDDSPLECCGWHSYFVSHGHGNGFLGGSSGDKTCIPAWTRRLHSGCMIYMVPPPRCKLPGAIQ
eukprot:6215066-Pyramimonas_sp.AAC.1